MKNTRPAILLIGSQTAIQPVARTLERIRADLWWSPWDDRVPSLMDDTTAAVILVAPLEGAPLPRALAQLHHAPEVGEVPLFPVVPDETSQSRIRRLYREGAAAVIEWPRERHLFPRLLVERLALAFVRGPQRDPDKALARTIRAHLRAVRGFERPPRVQVDAGVVVLSGHVDQLWQKLRIEKTVAAVPGVRSVSAQQLHVLPTERSDAKIRRDVVRLLRDTADLDDSTLAVSVRQGFVQLAGTVSDRRELNRCVRLIANLRGVRGVTPLTTVSLARRYRDHQVARRLRTLMSYLHTGKPVRVAFFDGVAVLSGEVGHLQDKRELEATVADDDAVQRVVNKLDVA